MNREFTAGFFFAGLGAGARGFLRATGKLGPDESAFRSLGGIDNDADSCADFEYLTRSRSLCADLSTLTPAELISFMGPRAPDCLFLSPPCKGFSGLLSKRQSLEPKYQALNQLVYQGLFLACETWPTPPGLIVLENVPRIRTRGRDLLLKAKTLLAGYGYAFHESTHECGEIGGLGQIRRRYLLVARHQRAVTAYVYRPPRQRVKACGEILAELPIPNDPAAGALHELPKISWLNWLRLALIPAGGDWRDLPGMRPKGEAFGHVDRVTPWTDAAGTVTASPAPSSGAAAVADPRVPLADSRSPVRGGTMGVNEWSVPAATVTGSMRVGGSNTPASVADPRVPMNLGPGTHENVYAVTSWEDPAGTVTSSGRPGGGGVSVADPRLPGLENPVPAGAERRSVFARYDVGAWDEPARAIAGSGTNGAFGIADPRAAALVAAVSMPVGDAWGRETKPQLMGVQPWDEPATAVVGKASVSGGNARAAVADPRIVELGDNPTRHRNKYAIVGWDEPAPTVTGATRPGSGAGTVADPRATGESWRGTYGVIDWREPAPTVRGAERVSQGAVAVADPRLGCTPRAGVYGVMRWEQAAHAVTGNARIDNGSFAVADPRLPEIRDPKRERPDFVPVIVSADGTWHRPLTTLELAALQGLPAVVDGAPLKLAGRAIGRWRERIGNAVPVGAAQAIAETLLKALLATALGTWTLGSTGIWVRDDGVTEDDALEGEGMAA